ncbi:uncharacterized protein LOC131994210 [Stomoxys calcitrans]|uniref:uncharacterized protein LOC131994210 n=1 Tax=Stomoxys calcitrans TaxID=35570 RepID=UPI0027E23D82|nr:uncharacterized protein LOC131994210 [Stomoxys calcitrans]
MYSLVRIVESMQIFESKKLQWNGRYTALYREKGTQALAFVIAKSASPYGKTKRRRWTVSDKDAVFSQFGDILLLEKLPSTSECLYAIRKYPSLQERTPQQLKACISNCRKEDKEDKCTEKIRKSKLKEISARRP